MRTYMERPITKETVAFGIGGQLHRDDGFPELPAKARVTFKADATFDTVKHKFLDKGTVEEILILTIDTSTFEVLGVAKPPVQEELPVEDDGE